ncbi:MAG: hypothetical protein ACT6U0_28010, partial [Shinella sp.]
HASAAFAGLSNAAASIDMAQNYFRLVEIAAETLAKDDANAFICVLNSGSDCLVEALNYIAAVQGARGEEGRVCLE